MVRPKKSRACFSLANDSKRYSCNWILSFLFWPLSPCLCLSYFLYTIQMSSRSVRWQIHTLSLSDHRAKPKQRCIFHHCFCLYTNEAMLFKRFALPSMNIICHDARRLRLQVLTCVTESERAQTMVTGKQFVQVMFGSTTTGSGSITITCTTLGPNLFCTFLSICQVQKERDDRNDAKS